MSHTAGSAYLFPLLSGYGLEASENIAENIIRTLLFT